VEYLEKLKKDIQIYFGSKGVISDHYPGLVGDLLNPPKLCLFFLVSVPEQLDEIRALLGNAKSPGKEITAFVFSYGYERLDVITHQSIFYFDLNDFTLLGKKKENLEEKFRKDKFDLLISFLFDYDIFCLKLISDISAEFKIGPVLPQKNNVFDLTIKHQNDLFSFESFYDQVIHYLGVLNINAKTFGH
jgi:hypothetical protein